ncbi:Hypothetical predicted protein [Paramuricea clavata]|uniref:Uncharacterized protein n=1 Tax=Paramuricea clavata TaxID=317549 RepID=A0A7D9DZI4_PARCT|nr:Hypothetical predicted protein [Paramuricea clavata]
MTYIKKGTVICVIFLVLWGVSSLVEAYDRCYSRSRCTSRYRSYKYCCKSKSSSYNTCRDSCVGSSCNSDTDCAAGECCDSSTDKCKTGHCNVSDGWIIAGIVIGVAVVAAVPSGIVFCCCRAARASRRPAHGGAVVMAQPATTGTTVLQTQQQNPVKQGQPMQFQNPQPYPNQPPPY